MTGRSDPLGRRLECTDNPRTTVLLTGVPVRTPSARADRQDSSADVSVPRPRTHDDRTGRVFPDHLITVPEIVIAISKNHNNDLQLRLETRETPQTKSNGEGSQAG